MISAHLSACAGVDEMPSRSMLAATVLRPSCLQKFSLTKLTWEAQSKTARQECGRPWLSKTLMATVARRTLDASRQVGESRAEIKDWADDPGFAWAMTVEDDAGCAFADDDAGCSKVW